MIGMVAWQSVGVWQCRTGDVLDLNCAPGGLPKLQCCLPTPIDTFAAHRLQLRDCEHALREAQVYGGLLPFLEEAAAQEAAEPGAPDGQRRPSRQQGSQLPGGAPGAGAGGSGAAPHPVVRSYHVLDAQLEAKLRQQADDLVRRQQVS
jgi:hypothetical protein